jgi:hypothetical protein
MTLAELSKSRRATACSGRRPAADRASGMAPRYRTAGPQCSEPDRGRIRRPQVAAVTAPAAGERPYALLPVCARWRGRKSLRDLLATPGPY